MGLSGLVGAGAVDGLEEVLARQLIQAQFEEQKRARGVQEAQSQERLSQDASQHTDRMDFERRQQDYVEGRDREAREGAAARASHEALARANMSELLNDPTQLAAFSMASGVDVPAGVRDLTKPKELKRTKITTIGPNGQPLARSFTDEELAAGVPEYREPKSTGGGGSGEQVWVMRNGKLTPIPKGTAQPGDTPHDPVAARSAQPTNNAEAVDTANQVIRIAKELRGHKGFNRAFGVADSMLPTFNQNTADAEVLRDTLQSLLTLENMGKMKGVLSDSDMKLLQRASTTINGRMSEGAAGQELDRLVEVMGRVVGGGAGAPAAPAPSPDGAPALRFVPGRGLVPVGQ